ncbi:integral membrane protein [Penicillium macrosclerotiorum]|uniref:uncharacterized protein n=1 Tax=Penicillium macrosclerotiorum TaxID=303699 RepID=UPI002548DDA7|nr:uncharacterized protein N7462_002245 [Penicillium macrosclerotiorum]KAJ5692822.1 integral membrane protein [Penicillium macrosclerotiorum]
MALNDTGLTLGSKISLPVSYIVASFLSVALYNVIELTITLFLTFKRRRGLYFWSFFVATWGIAIYAVGFILKDFGLATSISYFYVTLIVVGWCMMVTGQSLVLYSRLHLVVHSRLILRLVLGMIITNAIILHIPTIVLCYGANSPSFSRFETPYSVYEKIQVSIFFVQETIISYIYIHETRKLLRCEREFVELNGDSGKRLLLFLILINVTVIILDIFILVLEYVGRYTSQTAVKGFIYSVKLKLEFTILNRLVEFVQRSRCSVSSLVDGSGSQHSWNIRHEEQSTEIRHRRSHCSFAVFARKVHHELGISAEKYVLKVTHIVKRKQVVGACAASS